MRLSCFSLRKQVLLISTLIVHAEMTSIIHRSDRGDVMPTEEPQSCSFIVSNLSCVTIWITMRSHDLNMVQT